MSEGLTPEQKAERDKKKAKNANKKRPVMTFIVSDSPVELCKHKTDQPTIEAAFAEFCGQRKLEGKKMQACIRGHHDAMGPDIRKQTPAEKDEEIARLRKQLAEKQ